MLTEKMITSIPILTSSMMLVVVDLHGRSINVWFKSIEWVKKVWNRICVGYSRSSNSSSDSSTSLEDITTTGSSVYSQSNEKS